MSAPAPSAIRSTFTAILATLQAQLAAITSVDLARIIVVADDVVPHFTGDQDILLRPLGEKCDRNRLQGNGRVMDYRTRSLRIVARTRSTLDPVDEDYIHLTDATLGHLTLEDSIVEALQMFFPSDPSSNLLTACPIRALDWTEPRREAREQEWISSSLMAEIDYIRALNQAVQ